MSRALLRPSLSPKRLHQSSATHHYPPTSSSSDKTSTNDACYERIIQVWNTTCIVTNFGKKCLLSHFSSSFASSSSVDDASSPPKTQSSPPPSSEHQNKVLLINPANPNLSGVRDFPYFPKGGPVPKKQPDVSAHHIMGYVSQWGGMDVGSGMLFPVNVVDGLVHQLGGSKLQYECQFHRYTKGEDKACPIGQAIATTSGGANSKLQEEYDGIIHTTPPFYLYDGEKEEVMDGLKRCYRNSFELAFSHAQGGVGGDGSLLRGLFSSFSSLLQQGTFMAGEEDGGRENLVVAAVPLLGAGARGFPLDEALEVAALEAVRWRDCENTEEGEKEESSISVECGSDTIAIRKKDSGNRVVVAFGIPDPDIANMLVQKIESL